MIYIGNNKPPPTTTAAPIAVVFPTFQFVNGSRQYNDRMFMFVGTHTSTSRIGIVGPEKDHPAF